MSFAVSAWACGADLERREVAVNPGHRRRVDLDVEVGAFALDELLEGGIDVEHLCLYRAPVDAL